jgi:methionyl-tRNA formyltransferase
MSNNKPLAVVFAYHNVGVRCIKTLLARGIEIALVVTHEDSASESIWFESVADLCQQQNIATITPQDPNTPELIAQITAIAPDFIFSFYYRNMLSMSILDIPKHGAFNMHGSLLPKYRGRVPVNWAVLHGETETGATLHEMTAKPDAGGIVAQTAVPILPDDTAYEVFGKLTVAAEQTLWFALPSLLAGTNTMLANDLSKGSYFGGRKPEDGRIDWSKSAQEVYNLHRAVAPPYPGAFTDQNNHRFIIGKAQFSLSNKYSIMQNDTQKQHSHLQQGLCVVDNVIFGVCGDGHAILITELLFNKQLISAADLKAKLA